MIFGSLGDIVFTVSSEEIRTFTSLTWNSTARYEEHKRHIKDVLLEYTGTETETISFDMNLSVFQGLNPLEELTKILNAQRNGQAMYLVIGTHAYGKARWVITDTQKNLEKFDNTGNLLIAKIKISLKSYAER